MCGLANSPIPAIVTLKQHIGDLTMTEIVRAVFDTASTANAAMEDLKVARVPSAVMQMTSATVQRLQSNSPSDWRRSADAWQRPLVKVAVEEIHAPMVVGILNLYGPLHIDHQAA